MTVHCKLCVDCADPHLLADFWAEATGYVVEDNSALIERLLAEGHIGEDLLVEVGGRKAWKTAAAIRDPAAPVDPHSGVGEGVRMLFQQVPEPKTVKNRMHLDLHYGADRIDAEAARLEGLGATRLAEHREGPSRWIVMGDPEGNEFCVHS
ncbi:MAG TPA: VOC family protein [Glycomyces sp.]|nr:VOC family protein [Glycomyces sp.]